MKSTQAAVAPQAGTSGLITSLRAVWSVLVTLCLTGAAVAQSQGVELWPAGSASRLAAVPTSPLVRVQIGATAAVGLRADGTLVGWGDNNGGEINGLPSGTFADFDQTEDFGVGLRTDGTVVTWGQDLGSGAVTGGPGPGTYTLVRGGFRAAIALRSDGVLRGWGGAASPVTFAGFPTSAETFTTAAIGFAGGVAIRPDGTLRAWGSSGSGLLTPPAGTFTAVACAASVYLALGQDGEIIAWGNPADPLRTTLPAGPFYAVVTDGLANAAAQRADGTWVVWGASAAVRAIPPLAFSDVAISNSYGVGVKSVAPQGSMPTTYQGLLTLGATPVAGPADLRFTVFDAATDGSPIGTTTEALGVALDQAGRFTAQIDPGAGVFAGSPRWLQIEARTQNSGTEYVTLSPRQALTAAPYAAHALTAGSVPWSGITGAPFALSSGGDLVIPGSLGLGGSLSRLVVSPNFVAEVACADFKIGHPQRRGSPGRAMVDFRDGSSLPVLVLNFGTDWQRVDVGSPLLVGGSVTASGFVNSSDERLKTDVQPVGDALDRLAALKAVTFSWRGREFPERHLPDGRSLGLLAQDVQRVAPELVAQDPAGMLAVDYGRLGAVTAQAVNDLRGRTDAELAALRAENAELRARLERLERLLSKP